MARCQVGSQASAASRQGEEIVTEIVQRLDTGLYIAARGQSYALGSSATAAVKSLQKKLSDRRRDRRRKKIDNRRPKR